MDISGPLRRNHPQHTVVCIAPLTWWLFLLHSAHLPITELMLQQLWAEAETSILNFHLLFYLFQDLNGAEQ